MSSPSNADSSPAEIRGEIIRTVAVTLGLVLALSLVAQVVGFLSRNLAVGVALIFLAVPYVMVDRRGRKPSSYGLTAGRFWHGLAWGLGAAMLTVIPFLGGYWVWETQWRNRSASVSLDNLEQWPVQDRGEPAEWGRSPGAWMWAERRAFHLGIKRGEAPVEISLRCTPACAPETLGPVERMAAGDDTTGQKNRQRATEWHLQVTQTAARAHVTIRAPSAGRTAAPETIEVELSSPEDFPMYRGPRATPVDRDATFHRSSWWLALWLLTQVALVALPEEFFYRGYLQTRLRHWFRAGDDSEPDTGWPVRDGADQHTRRAWLGVTPENLVTSTIFALGHLLIPVGGQILANRAAVFFPALAFGWLRDRTGYITAPVVYHTACNMLVILSAPHFY